MSFESEPGSKASSVFALCPGAACLTLPDPVSWSREDPIRSFVHWLFPRNLSSSCSDAGRGQGAELVPAPRVLSTHAVNYLCLVPGSSGCKENVCARVGVC